MLNLLLCQENQDFISLEPQMEKVFDFWSKNKCDDIVKKVIHGRASYGL